MKNHISLVLLFVFAGSFALAQVSFEKRLEFDLKSDYNGQTVYEFGEYGMVIRSYREKKAGRTTEWNYHLYDIEFRDIKSDSVILDKLFFPDMTKNTETHSHTLFKKRDEYKLLSVRVPTLERELVSFTLPRKTRTTGMTVLGDFVYITGYLKKAPQLYIVNWHTGDLSVVPVRVSGVKMKKAFIERMQVLEESNEVMVFINIPVKKGEYDVYVIRLDEAGKKQEQYNLNGREKKNFTEISASRISEESFIFTGTYAERGTTVSQGLFFAKASGGVMDFTSYYRFVDLDNFRTFMPRRTKKKLARKERKGKDVDINYRIASHKVKILEDGYLFLGEAYYPTYRTQTHTSTTWVNGRAVTNRTTTTVFDGYQYTHAVLAKFSPNGDMQWDQSFEMWQAYKPFFPKRFIKTEDNIKDEMSLVFSSRSRIISKSFSMDGEEITEHESDIIEPLNDSDKIKRSYSNLLYWYDNFFLAYGQQKIKNTEDKNTKRKRRVFFVSKIAY